ncbi:MAG: RdgB/HAM1 family non-canonical purine NTP pyrophosphatase [Desulfovibrio sp.]|nr:RdgB/HAM1 family non-canonical purine NTP pyrophosphatase [Desulfovibrio sp.]
MPAASVVLATRNKGKIREMEFLLAPFGVSTAGLDAFPSLGVLEEDGTSFAENALLKARAACDATGLPAVADDSGLEVEGLGGAPGIRSARYASVDGKDAPDTANVEKLLRDLREMHGAKRRARFRCVIAACAPGVESITAEGTWEGVIAERASGNNGFGYDPVFVDPTSGLTAAQMTAAEKNMRSHRFAAASGLLRLWPAFWAAYLSRGGLFGTQSHTP